MKRSMSLSCAVGLLAASALLIADDLPLKGATARGIIRTGVDNKGVVHGDLKKVTGLENMIAINYKVLLLNNEGKETVVDEKKHTFKIGNQFRLSIESAQNMYLYVFHEGPDGHRTVLMPDTSDQGRVPMVKAGATIKLPDDGTYFEFTQPAGIEKLLVFASFEKRPQLTPADAFKADADQKTQIKMKSEQDQVFKTNAEKGPLKTFSDPDIAKVAQSNSQVPEFRLRGLRWEPEPENPEDGKTIGYGTYSAETKPELYVPIVLTSSK